MGKKQEISTEQDFDVFKILYTSSCKEAGIGLQNKAAALHALIQKLSENPDDDKIKDLFFQTLAYLELLCTNFHDYSNYEVAEEYVMQHWMHYTGSRSSLKMHFQITKTGQTLPSK